MTQIKVGNYYFYPLGGTSGAVFKVLSIEKSTDYVPKIVHLDIIFNDGRRAEGGERYDIVEMYSKEIPVECWLMCLLDHEFSLEDINGFVD